MAIKQFLTGAILVLLTTASHASDWSKEELTTGLKKEEWTKYVASGNKLRLGFLYAAKSDCSSMGTVVVRTIQSPEHGTLDTDAIEDFPTYKADSKFAKCNDKPMPGTAVYYRSNDDYVGPDGVKVLIIYPSGLAVETRVKIIVR